MHILISHPRFGSTWVYQYIKASNGGNHFYPAPEFLNPRWIEVMEANNVSCQQFHTFDQKRHFLEQQREQGVEWTYKVQGYHIEDLEWFHNFYKDWNRIILLRKDLWRAFLSYQVQSYLKWNIRTTHNRQNELKSNLQTFSIDITKVRHWFNQYQKLLNIDGTRVYMEDLTHNNLSQMFGVDINLNYSPYTLDYEQYVINLHEVMDEFHRLNSSPYHR